MKKIGILGAGTMGTGIAQTFGVKGFDVVVRDLSEKNLQKARKSIEKSLGKLIAKEKMEEVELEETMNRIDFTIEVEKIKDCDMVIEAVTENMAVKKKIFQELDEVCKEDTILATNTSSLSITEIATATSRPDKVLGMHFFNPVPMMKLVEIIKGITTDAKVKDQVVELTVNIGKTPVEVEEAPGFVVNRILVPMINEAIGVLGDGVAKAEDIDQAMKLGANHPIGPLALGDLIGLDVTLAIMEVLYEEFADSKYRPHPLLRKMVRAQKLGRKTGEGFYSYA
ncbi:3-hydroxybutyryl-CoA dehydrogenase [Isachenkonia alkalipeptolytica]|uniref:3-hydroxybutyryl-CoA dehydrogenase n=1 Tax=Isachenkonia alkalipeptolytica TaxID=2565777 RepID=A0AA43XKW4_9CLOT|nr:3-hydroxybutyryl-CoA dehydrogenase [Isachenkonia alkalipeptolytica]NBG88507.1 3-hydroxybutyryl-CoA dehydrogenase [Isachenkonia alkalipeptolytica]